MGCPLHGDQCPHYVPWSGSIPSRIAFIGEGPGENEIKQKQPFIGPAGKVFAEALDGAGIKRDEVFIYNAVPCFGHANLPYTPTDADVDAWRDHLQEILSQVQPKVVVAAGATALFALLGKKRITEHRGKPQSLRLKEWSCLLLPTFHPSYVMRELSTRKHILLADLVHARQLAHDEEEEEWAPYHLIDPSDRVSAEAALDEAFQSPVVAFDIESAGGPFQVHVTGEPDIVMIGVGVPGKTWVFPIEYSPRVWPAFNFHLDLKDFLRHHKGVRVGHNGKFDALFLRNSVPEKVSLFNWDTMLAAHLLDESRAERKGLSLKVLGQELFGIRPYWLKDVPQTVELKKGPKEIKRPIAALLKEGKARAIPTDMLAAYNAKDVVLTLRLYEHFHPLIEQDYKLSRLFHKLIIPMSQALEKVEIGGIGIDQEKLREEKEVLTLAKGLTEEVLNQQFPGVNWGSWQQISDVLYNQIKLPVVLRTEKTKAPATNEDALLLLRGKHRIIDDILIYRAVSKELGTYIAEFEEHLDSDGKIHPTFIVAGPSTGRTAARNPNVQNLPRGPGIRDIIAARAGFKLVGLDLSQIEVRWGAYIFQEPTLARLLMEGKDLHSYTASIAFGRAEVSEKERFLGKTANFLLLYGGGAERLAAELRSNGLSVDDAEKALTGMALPAKVLDPVHDLAVALYNAYHKAYPGVLLAHDRIRREALQNNKRLRSVFGRWRTLPDLDHPKFHFREHAIRQGNNTVVQGPASDTLLLAALQIINEVAPDHGGRVINLVHDSIDAEIPDENVNDYIHNALTVLRHPPLEEFDIAFPIPIEADAKVGQSFGSMTKFKEPTPPTPVPLSGDWTSGETTWVQIQVEKEPTMLEWAENYINQGFSIIPLSAPGMGYQGDAVGKAPIVRWEHYQKHKPSTAEIQSWWTPNAGPSLNMGIVTGNVSGLVVIDLDAGKGGLEWLNTLSEPLGKSAIVQTGGGGLHLYFRYDGPPITNRAGLAPGVDVRAEGGMVVAPPSRHRSGKNYTWQDPDAWMDIPPLPEFLKTMLTTQPEITPATPRFEGNGRAIPTERIEEIAMMMVPHYQEGNRHELQLALQGTLAKRNYSYNDVYALISRIVDMTNDSEPADRFRLLKDTYEKVRLGESVSGMRRLEDIIGLKDSHLLGKLLGTVRNSVLSHAMPVEEYINQELPRQNWIVDRLLPVGGLFMLSGHPGAGKTTMALQMALGMATGERVLEDFTVPKPLRVMYFQADNPPYMIQGMLRRMVRHFPPTEGRLYIADVVRPLKLNTPDGFAVMEQEIALYSPDVLFFDTIRDFHSADENNPTSVAEIIDALKRLRGSRDLAIGYLHHHSKSGQGERLFIEKHMGSMRFVTPVDLAMSLTFNDSDDAIVRLTFSKVRWWLKPSPRLYRREGDLYKFVSVSV